MRWDGWWTDAGECVTGGGGGGQCVPWTGSMR